MNTIKHKLVPVLFALLLCISSAFAEVDQNKSGLFTRDEYKLLEVNKIEEILTQFHLEDPDKNILFYIHGRKKDAAVEWNLIRRLEEKFNVRVVVFRWPSWSSKYTRPVDKAQGAAYELNETLNRIRSYKTHNQHIFEHKKLTLLAHSMGNVVFKEYVDKYYHGQLVDSTGPLFDNFLSVGADIGLLDHRESFEKIDFAKKKYVTMNKSDVILLLSNFLDFLNGKQRMYKLGLGFETLFISKKKIPQYTDPSFTYLDLSRSLRLDHRYFESNTREMLSIFKPLTNGEELDLLNLPFNKIKQEHNIYYLED